VLPYVQQGRLRALAVTGTRRSALLPDVPSMPEAGVANYEVYNYWGIVAPAGTPKEIVAKLNAEVQKLLANPEIREKLEKDGVDLTPSDPERMQSFVASDLSWTAEYEEAGLVIREDGGTSASTALGDTDRALLRDVKVQEKAG